jgi:hypothetical protein
MGVYRQIQMIFMKMIESADYTAFGVLGVKHRAQPRSL